MADSSTSNTRSLTSTTAKLSPSGEDGSVGSGGALRGRWATK